MSTRTGPRTITGTPVSTAPIAAVIGPADIELPPTEPIDLTAIVESTTRT